MIKMLKAYLSVAEQLEKRLFVRDAHTRTALIALDNLCLHMSDSLMSEWDEQRELVEVLISLHYTPTIPRM